MNTAINYPQVNPFLRDNDHSLNEDPDKAKRFEIHRLEWIESPWSLWNEAAEKLTRFEIVWITKGKGVLQVDGQNYGFTDNIIYCIAPSHMRKWSTEVNVEGYYISFTPEFIWLTEGYSHHSAWLEHYTNDFNITSCSINEEMKIELEIIVRKMKWEFSNYFNQKLEALKGLLNIFMIYFSRNLKDSRHDILQTRDAEIARTFMRLLKKNFISQKMVNDYARQLYVTPNYLNRTVKKITGFTASHHIQQQIVMEAKRQAMYSQESMKEIAYSLGFDNIAHFSKFFKNNCGMNFTDFKKASKKMG